MRIDFSEVDKTGIAEIISEAIIIHNVQDALEILVNCGYNGANSMIIHETAITPDFFDLKTGIAGEVLQKFSTYRMRLAIVGNFAKYTSKSLKDFIYESNKTGRINFTGSVSEAKTALAKM